MNELALVRALLRAVRRRMRVAWAVHTVQVVAPALVKPFARRLTELGIAHLDLTPVLRERSARGERLFFEVDIHPNPVGYQLIGDVVAEHLMQHAWD